MKKMNQMRKAQLIDAFKRADVDGNGFISSKELKEILSASDEKFTQADLKLIFEMIDDNRDGKIDIKEFIRGFQDI